jgi:hypothetical protein
LPTALHRSTAVSRCPGVLPTSPQEDGVARLDMTLVPIAPVAVEVCTYGGSPARALRSRVGFGGEAATSVVNAVNRVAGIDPLSGPRCEPGAAASVVVVVFDGLRFEQLLASRSGCRGVYNGLLSGAGTAPWNTVLDQAVALADRCAVWFGSTAGCVAGATS